MLLDFELSVILIVTFFKVIQGIELESLQPEAIEMIKAVRGDSVTLKMDTIWKDLQQHVDHVLDRDMNKSSSKSGNTWGFKQVIERKQGLFRMNMQGKRVNFAARYLF